MQGMCVTSVRTHSSTSRMLSGLPSTAQVHEGPFRMGGGGRAVLLVEDDPMSQLMFKTFLTTLGYVVTACRTGEEALAAYDKGSFRIVISDWRMPCMNGLDLCRRIRAQAGVRSSVYFILITGSCSKRVYEPLAHEAGVDDFLSKPIRLGELRMRLEVAQAALVSADSSFPGIAGCAGVA